MIRLALGVSCGLVFALAGCLGSDIDEGDGDEIVKVLPVITVHPRDTTVAEGALALFSVEATGALTYQWVRNGSDTLAGQTTATLVLQNVSFDDDGDRFKCVVGNEKGKVASNPAELEVYLGANSLPMILSQPAGAAVLTGGTATMSVTVAGQGLSYQWVRGTFDTLAGTNSPTLVLSNVTEAMDGTVYRLVARNDYGIVVSGPIVLNVHIPRSRLLDSGAVLYTNCAGCHGMNGEGGRAPPHANADFVMNNRQLVIRLVLRGNHEDPRTIDTLTVNGVPYAGGGMPGWADYLSNFQIASVLTYIRAVLNDSLVTNCNPNVLDANDFPVCVKTPRSAAAIAADSVAVWEVKAVRDSLFPN
jgi:hypothetical protein